MKIAGEVGLPSTPPCVSRSLTRSIQSLRCLSQADRACCGAGSGVTTDVAFTLCQRGSRKLAGAIRANCRGRARCQCARQRHARRSRVKPDDDRTGVDGGVEERRQFIRADSGKANLAPPEAATWYQHVPVNLANGDSVSIIAPWTMAGPMDCVTVADMHRVRSLAQTGRYRKDVRSDEWIGRAVAEILGLDTDDKGHRRRIGGILKVWFKNGVWATEDREDKRRKLRKFIVPGPWNDDEGPGG
jgi:hypothetical protein